MGKKLKVIIAMDEIERPHNPYYSRIDQSPLKLSDAEWRKILPEKIYHIARGRGTEYPFLGKYWNFNGIGTYHCAACGNRLFRSDAKFQSSCGWPSFFESVREDSVLYKPDDSFGMDRIEVLCGRCEAHLGHVFDDLTHTGKSYCMNSIVLEFVPDDQSESMQKQ